MNPIEPHPALKRLQPLIGTWRITGRTLGASQDDVRGQVEITWIVGGQFQEQRGEMEIVPTGLKVRALEVIGYDPKTDTFPSTVYGSLGGEPTSYGWDVRSNVVTHWTKGSKYTGRLSADGKTLTGGWRPDDGSTSPGPAYDAVMTKVE